MDASLAECLKTLSEIRHQIQTLNLEAELLREHPVRDGSQIETKFERLLDHLEANKSVKRQFDYRSLIVSIYGAIEQFFDGLVAEYVRAASCIVPTFADLPEPIRNRHLEGSLELIARVQQRNYKGDESVLAIVSRLYSCLTDDDSFSVNYMAFVNKRANYRREVINSVFSTIGVTTVLQKTKNLKCFKDRVESLFPDREFDHLDESTLFHLLDDLADRRNDVAHGNVSDTLSHDLLGPYVTLVEATVAAVHSVVFSALLPLYARYRAKMEAAPVAVYDNRIVCLKVDGVVVERGDLLLARPQNESHYVGGEILEIEVNGRQVTLVDGRATPVSAGFKVAFHAKDTYVYSIVQKSQIV